MVRRIAFLLLFLVTHCFSWAQNASESKGPMFYACKKGKTSLPSFKIQQNAISNALWHEADLLSFEMFVDLDPSIKFISGRITYNFKALANLNQVRLDFSDSLHVVEIRYHNAVISGIQANNVLKIDLPQSILKDQLDSISISYEGIPTSASGFGSFEIGMEDTVSRNPVLWTLSEPYGSYEWWPCKQDLNDKVDSFTVHITVPKENIAVSNGLLINLDSTLTTKTYTWKSISPIAHYLFAIAVAQYEVFSDTISSGNQIMQVDNYVYQNSKTEWVDQFKEFRSIFSLYEYLFGTYPFNTEKYGHAQFLWGGGMEHQTISFMYNLQFELLSHELAHQWFGDKVTCSSWADLWLNEGFATWSSGLCYERLLNGIWWPIWKKNTIESVLEEENGSVYRSDTLNVGSLFNYNLTYRKGSLILHMLRWELGDEILFSALKMYLNDPKLAYNFASTLALKTHLEAASGKDLTQFFNQWLYGEGYPTYTLSTKFEDNSALVLIDQQTINAKTPFYEMHLPVRFYNKQSGQHFDARIFNTIKQQLVEIKLPFKPDSVSFDPDLWILAGKTSFKSLVDQPLVYPNPASSKINVSIPFTAENKFFALYSLDGKLNTSSNIQSDKYVTEIDISTLSRGVYVLKTIADGYIWFHKIIVTH